MQRRQPSTANAPMGSQVTAAMCGLASVLPVTVGEKRRGRRAARDEKTKEDQGGDRTGATAEDQKEGGGGEESMEMVAPISTTATAHIQSQAKLQNEEWSIFRPSLLARWEEEKYEDGVKWKFLEHKGPYFPPEYQPLPDDVHFYYNG